MTKLNAHGTADHHPNRRRRWLAAGAVGIALCFAAAPVAAQDVPWGKEAPKKTPKKAVKKAAKKCSIHSKLFFCVIIRVVEKYFAHTVEVAC